MTLGEIIRELRVEVEAERPEVDPDESKELAECAFCRAHAEADGAVKLLAELERRLWVENIDTVNGRKVR